MNGFESGMHKIDESIALASRSTTDCGAGGWTLMSKVNHNVYCCRGSSPPKSISSPSLSIFLFVVVFDMHKILIKKIFKN